MNVWYMNGAGNDFMVIDARGQELDFGKLSVELCKLTGADGFMAVDYSDKADFRLHFYNSDGTRGEMCGNGARCICRFAHDIGLVGDTMVVETDAGLVPGWRLSESQFRVKLNNPSVLDLNRKPGVAYVELGDPGVPHAVAEVPGLTFENKADFWELGKALRHDPAFPKGANANMYTWTGENSVRILTFERGVEDYTLACGTGTGSTACVLWAEGKLPGGHLVAQNQGGTLEVTLEAGDGKISSILLEGPTEVVKVYEV
ncbi:MAG: diaminopimelate epimerase [Oscillospiraceae bacterium]|nr:diaminopimelate epimerase [Oscillospiraceae bacterium]